MILLELNGLSKKVSTGYSWKCLLVGIFYPMHRGDWMAVLRHFCYYSFFLIGYLHVPFFYNGRYIKRLIEKGYSPGDEKSLSYLERKFKYKATDELITKLRG
jgi:hypothetical protein